jgi:competence protein ComGC
MDASAKAEEEIARVLGELTQWVRKYSVEQRQPPASLDDLLAKGYLKEVPAAPAGKRFVITKNLQVELANR